MLNKYHHSQQVIQKGVFSKQIFTYYMKYVFTLFDYCDYNIRRKFVVYNVTERVMSSNTDYDYTSNNTDYSIESIEDDVESSEHKKEVRRRLEAKLERKRLKEELEDYEGELDDEFDWDDADK